jgi:glutamine---fructose-6-phosphate transaminase (isomerizing)
MCGIAAFLSTQTWSRTCDTVPLRIIASDLSQALALTDDGLLIGALDRLALLFPQLGSFALQRELSRDTAFLAQFRAMGDDLARHLRLTRERIARHGRTDQLERTQERLADYAWQIQNEVLGMVEKVAALMPKPLESLNESQHFLAWSVESVMQSIDKLEVRGRDSAGISMVMSLQGTDYPGDLLPPLLAQQLAQLQTADEVGEHQIRVGQDASGAWTMRAIYKVANLVGRLGDNGQALRAAIHADPILWAVGARLAQINVISHTRWASNGIINIPNCHPVDGRTFAIDGAQIEDNKDACAAVFVMNGDVDNYASLVSNSVEARGLKLNPAVTTDTKILPVVYTLDTDPGESMEQRFLGVMRRCHGSFAIGLQHLDCPDRLTLGQKGSGQALYLGQVPEGFVAASEVYGIAAVCRSYWPMNAGGEQGAVVHLKCGEEPQFTGQLLSDNSHWLPPTENIQIFARDIFRGDFPTYIEKEIAEAPAGIAKTLAGKYLHADGKIRFQVQSFGNGDMLLRRLVARDQPPIRRVIVVGQGTAAVAGMGIAHLIRRHITQAGITVEAGTASELFGFVSDGRFDDALVVAVSQSGTTTDTNRIVDLAKARGAWIHAIVNRRNSALVQKAHSFLYTSDGRDVEMSVASTKAYYAQVAAGKLLGLLLADQLGLLPDHALKEEIDALESLPGKVQAVLDQRQMIAEIAASRAPYARNWAMVGNGANRIAAQEIRIKLSELCYKAIPCDVTEDKKHIDLSTEPMTLVIANDLPEMVVSDTVKEVSIFKAHNGKPIVLCAEGENRFDAVAEATIKVPVVGAGLDFVVATVAGHLFGISAAQAIDQSCNPFRDVRGVLSQPTGAFAQADLLQPLNQCLTAIESGVTDSALAANLVVPMVRFQSWVQAAPASISADDPVLVAFRPHLNHVIEDLTRPIDTIRHQAKTVTVGISRPQSEVSPLILDALSGLMITLVSLSDRDRETLEMISPLVTGVEGAMVYEVTGHGTDPQAPEWYLKAIRSLHEDSLKTSRYLTPARAQGTKRRALRTGAAVAGVGLKGSETVMVVPLYTPTGTAISGLLLLHLAVAREASLQQKIAVLKAFGHKFDELAEHIADHAPGMTFNQILSERSPAVLIFCDLYKIIS